MLWKLCSLGDCETAAFAASELGKYLRIIDDDSEIAIMRSDCFNPEFKNVLWVGQDPAFKEKLPECTDPFIDDGICVDVDGANGVITGVNPRSVLIAAYRFLAELGCAWVRPGKDGEIIPRKKLGNNKVFVRETPSYRHRGVCIEGSVSCGHVYNMIDWLPKAGMNGYFIQFMVPFTFFDRWYNHTDNPALEPDEMSADEVSAIVRAHISEIKKRGLLYHAAGHGWTCEPFGIEGNSWDTKDYHIPPESEGFLAQVNGKRALSHGLPLNTNLCYSNAAVREKIISAIAAYCGQNREVDYLHFWLADGLNNHCECDGCKDILPADFYIQMLNELDEKLTSAGLNTKIVFLIYVDLLWEPQATRLVNPDRFVLMFAPITRTYSSAYTDADLSEPVTLAPYERNRLIMPQSVAENVARLRKWQERFSGDSFLFDYHLMWDHFRDPGYFKMSRVLFDDMKGLDTLRLNGMVSCQLQRICFPTGLGLSMMARALWNKNADFVKESDAYYSAAFGHGWQTAKEYLSTISELFDPVYMRHEKAQEDPAAALRFKKIPGVINKFESAIEDNLLYNRKSVKIKKSWEHLRLHAQLCLLMAKALLCKANGNRSDAEILWQDMASWARLHEKELEDVFDVYEFLLVMKNTITKDEASMF